MDKHTGGIFALIVAVTLMGLGVWSSSFWRVNKGGVEVNVGFVDVETCKAGECESQTLSQLLKGESETFVTLGAIAQYGTLVLLGTLVFALLLVFRPEWSLGSLSPARLGVLLSVVVLGCGIGFVLNKPAALSTPPFALPAGKSIWMHLSGAGAGLVGSLLLMLEQRASEVEAGDEPSPILVE